jgi:hypothetical protein
MWDGNRSQSKRPYRISVETVKKKPQIISEPGKKTQTVKYQAKHTLTHQK